MEVTNLLDIYTREEFYQWFLENHDKEKVCWIRINRAEKPIPDVVSYVDAVEVALCFGWIDSTQKRIDGGKPIQRFTPRRKGCIWCEQNIERCRRLIKLGEMTPAGKAVLPDMNPDHFVFLRLGHRCAQGRPDYLGILSEISRCLQTHQDLAHPTLLRHQTPRRSFQNLEKVCGRHAQWQNATRMERWRKT